MPDEPRARPTPGPDAPLESRLDSWKEIVLVLGDFSGDVWLMELDR